MFFLIDAHRGEPMATCCYGDVGGAGEDSDLDRLGGVGFDNLGVETIELGVSGSRLKVPTVRACLGQRVPTAQ